MPGKYVGDKVGVHDGALVGEVVGTGVGDEYSMMFVVVTTTLDALVMTLLEAKTEATVDVITLVNEESYTASVKLVIPYKLICTFARVLPNM